MRISQVVCAALLLLSFSHQGLAQPDEDNSDPWEPFNRQMFKFNQTADKYLLKPVAIGYKAVTPDVIEAGFTNIFNNFFEITTVVNDLLQLKFVQAAGGGGRFLINSTIGIVGFFDVATDIGLEYHEEDFGQTLGYWGVGPGPYIVVPLFGPYTLRDGIGDIFQSQTTGYVNAIDHVRSRNQTYMMEIVDQRAGLLAAEQLISGDRYIFIRDAYLQQRKSLVHDGVLDDDFGDEEDFDDWDE
jgi:phospholipid-binding lipoprotein MlaA